MFKHKVLSKTTKIFLVNNVGETGNSMRATTKLYNSWFTRENHGKRQVRVSLPGSELTSKNDLKNYPYKGAQI